MGTNFFHASSKNLNLALDIFVPLWYLEYSVSGKIACG
jgi:hypothetical protein